MILFAKPGFKGRATDAQYVERTIELIGKERCPKVEVIGISTWIVRETVAKYYSEGRVFAAGDAVRSTLNPALRLLSLNGISERYTVIHRSMDWAQTLHYKTPTISVGN